MAAFETTPVASSRADQPTIVQWFIATSERFLFHFPVASLVRVRAPFFCGVALYDDGRSCLPSDSCWSGQSVALSFFSDLDARVRKALGVVIIEGEHPGSSYYAAELRGDIANANQAAHALDLAFRFRAKGKDVAAKAPSSSVVAVFEKASV